LRKTKKAKVYISKFANKRIIVIEIIVKITIILKTIYLEKSIALLDALQVSFEVLIIEKAITEDPKRWTEVIIKELNRLIDTGTAEIIFSILSLG
jgi:hypothetical protein